VPLSSPRSYDYIHSFFHDAKRKSCSKTELRVSEQPRHRMVPCQHSEAAYVNFIFPGPGNLWYWFRFGERIITITEEPK
jgi:hypothetical protein